jgi:hypothetical protein
MTLAFVEARRSLKPIEGSQQVWADPVDLPLQHGIGGVGCNRHRKGPEVIEVQTR